MAEKKDNTDSFYRRPDRPPTDDNEDQYENFVQITVNGLRRATGQEVEWTLQNITSKPGFTRRVGGRLATEFEKEVRDRLARLRRGH